MANGQTVAISELRLCEYTSKQFIASFQRLNAISHTLQPRIMFRVVYNNILIIRHIMFIASRHCIYSCTQCNNLFTMSGVLKNLVMYQSVAMLSVPFATRSRLRR